MTAQAPIPDTVTTQAQFPAAFQGLFEPHRYKVFYGGRGGAKSWAFARALLLLGKQKPLRVLCAREFQNSIAESVHRILDDQNNMLSLGYTVEKARIYNSIGTEFFFEGIKHNVQKIKSYEGIDICWFEEAQLATEESMQVLVPTIRKDGSEIWISFNPDLETQYIYDRFVAHPSETEDALVVKVNHSDNPFFPEVLRKEMEELKKKDYDAYLNVWEGFPKVMLDGAVYADELRLMVAEGRLTSVPYNPELSVDTFWDLGWADRTAIWFAQVSGFEYHVIDYYEDSLKKLDFYLDILQRRGYIYDTHWLPHDAAAKQLGTGRSIQELLLAKGRKARIVPKLSLADGINAARTIFQNIWIDQEECKEGVKALRHYRYEVVDDGSGHLSKEPIHDWSSHGADAFRYLAIALRQPRKKGNPRLEDRSKTLELSPRYAGESPMAGLGWMR